MHFREANKDYPWNRGSREIHFLRYASVRPATMSIFKRKLSARKVKYKLRGEKIHETQRKEKNYG
jgi:hypothetical protein